MTKKIVIAGGTGFVGNYLSSKFEAMGYDVQIISTQKPNIPWHDTNGIREALENAETLINLAGRSVDCRYTKENKREILESRTETTKILGKILQECSNPPMLWINS